MAERILIVEDEKEVANLMAGRLRKHGYEVEVTYDAALSVDYLNRNVINLIILDLRIPAGGGIFVLERLKSSLGKRHIPVIVQTGNRDEELKKQILDLGVANYIEKPYSFEELLCAIQTVTSQSMEITLDAPVEEDSNEEE